MGRDTGAARERPGTHGDASPPVVITPEEHEAERTSRVAPAVSAPVADGGAATRPDPSPEMVTEPYRQGDFMGRPFHQCPHCPMSGISSRFIEKHIQAVHVRKAPTDAQRAAAAGLIVPGNE